MRELKLHLRRAIPLIVFLALLVHFILPRVGQIEHSASIIPTMIPWWILAAIVAHDSAAARAAMQRHLTQAYKRFSTGWDSLH